MTLDKAIESCEKEIMDSMTEAYRAVLRGNEEQAELLLKSAIENRRVIGWLKELKERREADELQRNQKV